MCHWKNHQSGNYHVSMLSRKDVKLPNVSIQIISFPLATSYTVNLSSLMYTEQGIQLKKFPLCAWKGKKKLQDLV